MSNQTKSNSTEDLRSFLLANLAINVYTDKLSLFLIIPMGIVGTVFNLISFSVFCKKTFGDVALFKYLRVYTFSSLIVSSSLIFSFYFSPYTLPELLLAYSTRIYACQLAPSYVTIFFTRKSLATLFWNLATLKRVATPSLRTADLRI